MPASKADEAAVQTPGSLWVRNTASLVGVYVVGIVAWFISFKAGAWNVGDDPGGAPVDEEENPWEFLGLALGYVSAVCYLWYGPSDGIVVASLLTQTTAPEFPKSSRTTGRSPVKVRYDLKLYSMNRHADCIAGLALLFFMLSLTGNLTYGVSLLAFSQKKKYLLNALPFLLGSVGTIVEDCIIFVQFRLYADGKRPRPA